MFEKLKKLLKKGENKMADLDKMLEGLSDEEKKELKAKLDSLYEAEAEEVVEEEKVDDTEEVAEEEVKEESNEAEETVEETTEEVAEETEVTEQVAEEQPKADDRLGKLEEQMSKVLELLTKKEGVEAKAEEVYGLGNGVFQDEDKAPESKKISASEIAQLLNKIKR